MKALLRSVLVIDTQDRSEDPGTGPQFRKASDHRQHRLQTSDVVSCSFSWCPDFGAFASKPSARSDGDEVAYQLQSSTRRISPAKPLRSSSSGADTAPHRKGRCCVDRGQERPPNPTRVGLELNSGAELG